MVLTAFFVIGMGFNFQLVAGNPLLSGLGAPDGSSSRLNLGNALGAIAQIIAPFILTLIIPASIAGGDRQDALHERAVPGDWSRPYRHLPSHVDGRKR